MKKAISLVGVGAMVITLGLGTGFAQTAQTTPKMATAPAVEAKQDVQKEVLKEAPKQPGDVKSDATAPVKPSEPSPAGLKSGDAKSDKTATAKEAAPIKVDALKPAVENKATIPAPAKTAPALNEAKSGATKGVEEAKTDKTAPAKAVSGTADEKKADQKKDSMEPTAKK